MSENKQVLDISWGAMMKILLAIMMGYFLYLISDTLVLVVFAIIISILFNPIVDFMQKLRIPRAIGAGIAYVGVFGLLSLLIYSIIPGLYEEMKSFSAVLPTYIERISPFLSNIGVEGFQNIDEIVETLRESSDEVARNLFNALSIIFGGISAALFTISLAFFFSLEGNSVERAIKIFIPKERINYTLFVWKKGRDQVTRWFLVRIMASLFVGVSSFIVFYIFNVNYALLFAIIGGLFNIVPFIGPLIAVLIFFAIISLESMTQAVFVLIAFSVIQGIESIITPILSEKIMGVSPALVLIAIVIGGSLWGALGAILAIPLMAIIFEFLKSYLESKKERGEIV